MPTELSEAERKERETMIQGIGALEDMTVREVMVPRIDVEFISADISLDQFYEVIGEHGYSRYPVFGESSDDIIGVLYSKDLLKKGIREHFDVRKLMRPAYFVPDSKHLDDLLRDFKKRKVHIAVAVDEYGGVSGIVCMEDILEVIVGDIQDEFDEDEEDDIIQLDASTYQVDARCNIEEINGRFHLNLDEDDFETIGGYVFELFGRIPLKGEHVDDGQAVFTVEDIEGHKINKIKLQLRPAADQQQKG
ncbi:MAG: hemolysin family protein [Spirochaetia bacterium]|jgi:CBS domain containing-hemolysin-like protein|nr:hemolysin family protein [Spirochaetia bacterium]